MGHHHARGPPRLGAFSRDTRDGGLAPVARGTSGRAVRLNGSFATGFVLHTATCSLTRRGISPAVFVFSRIRTRKKCREELPHSKITGGSVQEICGDCCRILGTLAP